MKIYDGYILAVEFYKKANKSASWVHIVKNIQVEYMGYVPVVKIETLPEKYKAIAKKMSRPEKLLQLFNIFNRNW